MIELDRDLFYAAVRQRLARLKQRQVDAFELILDAMAEDEHLTDPRHAAYMLGTTWWETGQTMEPISEQGKISYFDKYDPIRARTTARRARARAMGNLREGDGYRFRGRGYVQLTWANNYRRASQVVGIDLVAEPDRAMDPEIAYQIMSHGMRLGWFTGKRLSDYIRPGKHDYVNARRIINGNDKDILIAGFAEHFEAAILGALKKTGAAT